MLQPDYYTHLLEDLRARPRTWLITGVAGFIGSHLLAALLGLGQKVVGLDNFSSGHKNRLDGASDRFSLIEGDIRDLETCRRVAKRCDYILHHAALVSVPRSIEDPLLTNAINIDGFVNMLVVARDSGVKRFVYATSSAVYGDHPGLPQVESEIGRPMSPYALSKYMNELYADMFARAYGLPSIGLRYFNIFGQRQDPNGPYAAVIPQWISAMIKGEPIYINGDGETSRDFCYIDDVVQANLLAALCDNEAAVNQVYNIAVGERTTLNELYACLRDHHPSLVNAKPIYREFRTGDIRHSVADIEKARTLLGYKPVYTAPEGLKLAMDWYRVQGEAK